MIFFYLCKSFHSGFKRLLARGFHAGRWARSLCFFLSCHSIRWSFYRFHWQLILVKLFGGKCSIQEYFRAGPAIVDIACRRKSVQNLING